MFYSRPVEDSVGDVRSKMRDLGTVPEKALKGQALSLSTRYVFDTNFVQCSVNNYQVSASQSEAGGVHNVLASISIKSPWLYSNSDTDLEVNLSRKHQHCSTYHANRSCPPTTHDYPTFPNATALGRETNRISDRRRSPRALTSPESMSTHTYHIPTNQTDPPLGTS